MDESLRQRARRAETAEEALALLRGQERATGDVYAPPRGALGSGRGSSRHWRPSLYRLFLQLWDVSRVHSEGDECISALWPARAGRACRTNLDRPLPWCSCGVTGEIDHPAVFERSDGSRLMVAHPYDRPSSDLPECLAPAREWLRATWLDESWSFYNPGQTSMLVLEPAGKLPSAREWRLKERTQWLEGLRNSRLDQSQIARKWGS